MWIEVSIFESLASTKSKPSWTGKFLRNIRPFSLHVNEAQYFTRVGLEISRVRFRIMSSFAKLDWFIQGKRAAYLPPAD